MIKEYISKIKNIVNSNNLEEIKILFNEIAYVLNNGDYDIDFDKKIILQMRREINKYRKSFKDKYPDIKNLYIYPDNYSFLYFYSIIIEFYDKEKSNFKLINYINVCIELLGNFNLVREQHIPFDTQMELLFIADSKYNLFSLLNSTNKIFHLYNFPCLFNQDSCDITAKTNNKEVLFELLLFDQEVVDRNIECLYLTLIGRILNFILIDNLDEGPYGMIRFLKKINFNYDNAYKDDAPIIFSYLFSIALLCDSKYEYILNDNEKILAPLIDKYIKNIINIYRNEDNVDESIEFLDDDLCPCGSGKLYRDCCKKKRFKWITDGNKISKQIPITKEVVNSFSSIKDFTENILGRKLLNSEKIVKLTAGPDLNMNEFISKLRNVGLPENKLYASYKTGLFISDFNVDLLPDYELESWDEALEEYEYLTNSNENGINYIEFIKKLNDKLKRIWQTYLNDALSILNLFINDVKENFFENTIFEINDINDFAVFCVRRIIKNCEALISDLKNNRYEISMSIVRMLYEDLININVYVNDHIMFNNHIMPLILIEKGIYERLTDNNGNISYKTAINPETNEKINYSITLKDLSKKSREEYRLLYDELFRDLSAYTHLNITVKDIYFSNPDPFLEIERVNVAGVLGLFFINQIIYELAYVPKVSDFTYRDLLFFSDKVKEELLNIFTVMINIHPHEKKLYEILIRCINDYDILK